MQIFLTGIRKGNSTMKKTIKGSYQLLPDYVDYHKLTGSAQVLLCNSLG